MTHSKRASAHPLILTVGHSNHPISEFVALLKSHNVTRLVDVRTIPKSRHNPQFNRDALAASLRAAHIAYTHLPKLGGLRHARPDSLNTGWNNSSFRGFADYMQTPEFAAALARLEELAKTELCAIMCAEAVPWRCHRSLIADALTVRGHAVRHIMTGTRANPHKLTPFARVRGKRITYPPNNSTRAHARKKAAVAAEKLRKDEGANSMIEIARVYDKPRAKSLNSARYLVERLWPRGIKKGSLQLDGWLKDIAPSAVLRKWFGHKPERWPEFRKRYLTELRKNSTAWQPLLHAACHGSVTLLYSARDTEHNSAIILRDFLNSKQKKSA